MTAVDVLVVGAGPAGLALALQAHAHGARVEVIDRRPIPARPSRAVLLHPRTLEVLRPLGVVDDILAGADRSPAASLHLGRRTVRAGLSRLDLPDTAYPHLTLVRQMHVEAVLAAAVEARGIPLRWHSELVDLFDQSVHEGAVRATVRSGGGASEERAARFVVGCDGPDSAVRNLLGIGWRGGPYPEEVILADVELAGGLDPSVAHAIPHPLGLLFAFPLREAATWRILATRPSTGDGDGDAPFGQPGPAVPPAELQAVLDSFGFDAALSEVAWSARVRVQHRLADRFRRGRVFLAGDAAHAHSPAGAQGLNTGIPDAVNLGWKLAFAPSARNSSDLLDSYELERRPVARRVVALTHLLFRAEASLSPVPAFLRATAVPAAAPLLPFLLGRRRLVAAGIRVLSQLRVGYPAGPLGVNDLGWARRPRPGRRLPDMDVRDGSVSGRSARLHDLTAKPGVHVLQPSGAPTIPDAALGPHVHVHRLASVPGGGSLIVRPDGYVGARVAAGDVDRVVAWLADVGATTADTSTAPRVAMP